MGSVNPPKKRDYGNKTQIDLNQSYQVAYWKDRFGVTEAELERGGARRRRPSAQGRGSSAGQGRRPLGRAKAPKPGTTG